MAWISFGALTCRKKKTWWQLASRCCWNGARPWDASELVSFLVGLRTYQHPCMFFELPVIIQQLITRGQHRISDMNSGKPSAPPSRSYQQNVLQVSKRSAIKGSRHNPWMTVTNQKTRNLQWKCEKLFELPCSADHSLIKTSCPACHKQCADTREVS